MKRKTIRVTKPYLIEGIVLKKGARVIVESDDITSTVPPATSSNTSPNSEDLDMYAMRRNRKFRNARRRAEDEVFIDDEVLDEEDDFDTEVANDIMALRRARLARLRRLRRAKKAEDEANSDDENKEDDKETSDEE